ncbi:MAG TPA: serine/threonine-protein kinase [Vicinamibacterales bacterium]|nr:serine/threonine-protein kinase [Vicinamibacterales bacterium]
MFSPGQVLDDRYEIVALLAEGGMGAVYRARRTLLGDEVAIKIVRGDHTGPGPRDRFFRESRASARLRHPNIVSILDFNVDDENHPFLVMELLNGLSVRDEIVARGRLDLAEVLQIVPPLCSALQFAHDLGIVHRDLKPANIVYHEFAPGERVYKLVDFGLANLRDTDETRLTGPHEFLGTIAYASPEQLSGAVVDERSDIYSMGVVIFEMLTGRQPFVGPDPMAVLNAHLTGPIPRLSTFVADVPAWVDLAIGRALAKQADDRWSTIAELGHALLAGGSGSSTTAIRTAPAAGGLMATYELGERIGPGRLGSVVYRGTHRALGHPVAIRILRRDTQRNWEGARARFMREAQTLQVAHPSIIQVRDYGEEPDFVYLVTDYIEGSSLREVMNAAGPMPWTRLKPLLAQLVEATRMLHRRKGLLCGVSPDIMRVTTDDEGERLLISSAGVWQAQDLLATLQDQTLRGIALADGELRYTAPELLTGRCADVRSDVFTMGVLAYEMATATLPYDGSSMQELLGNMLRGQPADPSTLQPTLPAHAAAAILNALQPSPAARFATAREFGERLLNA